MNPVLPPFECPKCGGPLGGMTCTVCNHTYETVLGVPFIGEFEAEDALGLIEIAANATNRAGLTIDASTVARLDALCAAYHAASNKEAFKAANEEACSFYFANRYHEWLAVETLLEGHDLTGRDVLDIGAGQGFDAWRLTLRGARVTAVEFSPILAEAGKRFFPDLRWVGGFSHALPFPNAAFDYVFINAALHHMRDIPVCIAEALRVLRPGGTLITSGDPFRSEGAGPALEFEIFDRHEAVLLGINEQIPRIADIVATLEANRCILDSEIFTSMVYGGRSGVGPDLADWTRWDLDTDAELLKRRSGSVAMRVRLVAPWPHARNLQRAGLLSAASFASWLDDYETAAAQLARIIPRRFIDTPFPGEPSKFDLLNGWRVARSTPQSRTGYRRGRLFRTRIPGTSVLAFEICSPERAEFEFRVNAARVGETTVYPFWKRVCIDITSVPEAEVFVLEFKRRDIAQDFDANCFLVRNARRRLLPTQFLSDSMQWRLHRAIQAIDIAKI